MTKEQRGQAVEKTLQAFGKAGIVLAPEEAASTGMRIMLV